MDVREIIYRLGRRRVEERLGVGSSQVSNAITDNRMPGAWFGTIEALTIEDQWDDELPRALFNWRIARKDAA